jgi:hypothetical protein
MGNPNKTRHLEIHLRLKNEVKVLRTFLKHLRLRLARELSDDLSALLRIAAQYRC